MGRTGWAPANSVSAQREPSEADQHGDDELYLANISCFGPGLDCLAPGVGIVSTIPPRPDDPSPWVAMDGTSSSSPAVCGALAAKLAELPAYLAMPRDRARAETARQLLLDACRSTGLASGYEGSGVPRL